MDRIVLNLRDERHRVAARCVLALIERDGDCLPEAMKMINDVLDEYDRQGVHERNAVICLDES